MVFLTELMGTRYVINALSDRLSAALEALSDGETVDLSRAKLGPGAYNIIVGHMKRLNFVNSSDEELDSILQERQRKIRSVLPVNMESPTIETWDDLIDYVYSLPADYKYYKWKPSTSRNVNFAIIAAALVHTRKVVDFSNNYQDIFVLLNWLGCPKSHTPVYLNKDNPNYVSTKVPNGDYLEIPAEFGFGAPIDLRNPDPTHIFYNVIMKMKSCYEEEKYESFVDAAKRLLLN